MDFFQIPRNLHFEFCDVHGRGEDRKVVRKGSLLAINFRKIRNVKVKQRRRQNGALRDAETVLLESRSLSLEDDGLMPAFEPTGQPAHDVGVDLG